MGAFRHLDPTHLLRDTCSIEPYSGVTKSTAHVPTETFSTAATWKCNAMPKTRWETNQPGGVLKSELDIYLPGACTVARKDRLTHTLIKYRVVDVQTLSGGGVIAMCKRWEQVTG